MSNIRHVGAPLNFMGRDYSLLFTVNVIDQVQDRFGINISDIIKVIGGGAGKKFNANVCAVLTYLLNDNIETQNEDLSKEERIPLLTEEKVRRHVVPSQNLPECYEAIVQAYLESFPHKKKDEDDIGEDDPNRTRAAG